MVGVFLVLLGVASFAIPILPNWLFIIPGLALLATEFRHARRLIIWLRTRLRLRRMFRKKRTSPAASPGASAAPNPGAAPERKDP